MKKPRNDEQANPMPGKIRTGLCAAVPLLLAVRLAAAAVYRLVNTGAVGWEALGFAAMGVVSVSRNQGKEKGCPAKGFYGRSAARWRRRGGQEKRRRAYLLDSLIVALVFAGLDILFIGSGRDAARGIHTARISLSRRCGGHDPHRRQNMARTSADFLHMESSLRRKSGQKIQADGARNAAGVTRKLHGVSDRQGGNHVLRSSSCA